MRRLFHRATYWIGRLQGFGISKLWSKLKKVVGLEYFWDQGRKDAVPTILLKESIRNPNERSRSRNPIKKSRVTKKTTKIYFHFHIFIGYLEIWYIGYLSVFSSSETKGLYNNYIPLIITKTSKPLIWFLSKPFILQLMSQCFDGCWLWSIMERLHIPVKTSVGTLT